jgi:aminoglycoside phosphotransferase (APT) family kinase protein
MLQPWARWGGLFCAHSKAPLGPRLASAHDMAREHRVISALAGTSVPVPATILHCADPAVLGAPFYLMAKVEGTVYRNPAQTDRLPAAARLRLSRALVETLAALHQVDPVAVGLADFGRPDGFLTRQVRRWSRQLDSSRSRALPGIDALASQLAGSAPDSLPATIVHGDYRLDNVLVRGDAIAAVLDWEMSTLGDPLTDLGLLVVYWEVVPALESPILKGAGPRHGFQAANTLTRWYAEATGADLTALAWYEALASFKLAVILEGIHYRYGHGLTVGDGFDQIGALVPPLVAHGLARLAQDWI